MPVTEHDSALISQAAIAVGKERGLQKLPAALPAPLPEGQRQYLYTVSDTHPLQEVYGASRLSAILVDTQTPHLADRNPRGPADGNGQRPARFGLRYCDRREQLDERLVPFTSGTAKQAWRQESDLRRQEQRSVSEAARALQGKEQTAALTILPEPKEGLDNLQEKSPSAISATRGTHSSRDNSR